MTGRLVLLVIALGALGCSDTSWQRTRKQPQDHPARVEPQPQRPRHASHEHPHGAHPHPRDEHHHHPHPHPHLAGLNGHHHPY